MCPVAGGKVTDHLFGRIEHDRYWRMWTGKRSLTLTFGNSVNIFDNERLELSSNFSYSVNRLVTEESRTVERQLEGFSTKLTFGHREEVG